MIPAPLAGLIHSLRSLWAIELLLLLHHDRTRAWSVEDMVRELRSNPALVGDVLSLLEEIGLVAREADGSHRYRSPSLEMEALVVELARLHAERPLAIAQMIHGAPNEKLRAFSDAFKLKKD